MIRALISKPLQSQLTLAFTCQRLVCNISRAISHSLLGLVGSGGVEADGIVVTGRGVHQRSSLRVSRHFVVCLSRFWFLSNCWMVVEYWKGKRAAITEYKHASGQ